MGTQKQLNRERKNNSIFIHVFGNTYNLSWKNHPNLS